MDNDPDEEEMDDVNIDNEKEQHWRNVFEENEGGVDDKKVFLCAKRCDLYVNKKEQLVRVNIWLKLLVTIKRRCFGKWLVIMW